MLKICLFLVVLFVLATQIVAALRERQTNIAFPPEGQFVDVNGVKIHVVVKGNGPDLVLIHGASGSTREFTLDFMDRLTDRYTVYVVDRPGLGHSASVEPRDTNVFSTVGATPTAQADVLAKAVAKMGAENPIVLGHSYGGIVALAWAGLPEPDLAGLVLVSGASNPWKDGLGWYYDVNGSLLGGAVVPPILAAFAPKSAIEATVSTIFEPQSAPPEYASNVGAQLVLRRDSLRANARQIANLLPHIIDLVPSYQEIDLPVEIIHGDADTVVPLSIHSAVLVDQIKGANLTILPGIGHMPHHTNPQDVIAAIDRVQAQSLR